MAREAFLLNQSSSLATRFPIIISSIFGLLHGLGFAAVFEAFIQHESSVVLPLISFNLGIEFAQIAIVLLCFGGFTWVRSIPMTVCPSFTSSSVGSGHQRRLRARSQNVRSRHLVRGQGWSGRVDAQVFRCQRREANVPCEP